MVVEQWGAETASKQEIASFYYFSKDYRGKEKKTPETIFCHLPWVLALP